MRVRLAQIQDLPSIMQNINNARIFLKKLGINQWQRKYPNENVILKDIFYKKCYVWEVQDKIVGSLVISFDGDEDYDKIYAGNWIKSEKYLVIHRVVVANDFKGQGLASKMLKYAEKISKQKQIYYAKIDTHEKNYNMQNVLNKNGYSYRGLINIADGTSRIVFDKIF